MAEAAESIPDIESPCTGVCTLDTDNLCIGCFRTTNEIAAWLTYPPLRRRQIMADLPLRAARCFDD